MTASAPSQSAHDAVVIGAGAAGLAAAHALRRAGRDVLVLEARDAPGGVMQTAQRDGFTFERGPNSLRVTAPLLDLLRAAGVEALLEKAGPASRARYLLRESGLVPVPLGPLSFAASGLLSARGKLRLLAEPLIARRDGASESVAQFVARRLGPEALDKLVAPFLTGVYAGDETQLGAGAVFPSLVRFERERGSIALGAIATAFARAPRGLPDSPPLGSASLRGRASRGLAGSYSARGGLGALAAAFARALGEGALRCSSAAQHIERDGCGWRVGLASGEIRAKSLVLAVDAPAAAKLLAPLDAEAGKLAAGVAYAPIASVALDVDPRALRRPLAGFGFLVPRDQGLDLLGALFMSQLFSGRVPAGRELVSALIGGARWPGVVDASDEEITRRVAAGLDRALGLEATPRVLAISRWTHAVPQPGVDHPARIAALRARFASGPPLAFAGGWLDGVALSDAFASGLAAGRGLVGPARP
ncbi:MAG TPA: protoporphyrinogen oxidase [Myxococcota bacterium]|nr:protoporphyrinogen oxidase [Myxococcota bacterium]